MPRLNIRNGKLLTNDGGTALSVTEPGECCCDEGFEPFLFCLKPAPAGSAIAFNLTVNSTRYQRPATGPCPCVISVQRRVTGSASGAETIFPSGASCFLPRPIVPSGPGLLIENNPTFCPTNTYETVTVATPAQVRVIHSCECAGGTVFVNTLRVAVTISFGTSSFGDGVDATIDLQTGVVTVASAFVTVTAFTVTYDGSTLSVYMAFEKSQPISSTCGDYTIHESSNSLVWSCSDLVSCSPGLCIPALVEGQVPTGHVQTETTVLGEETLPPEEDGGCVSCFGDELTPT